MQNRELKIYFPYYIILEIYIPLINTLIMNDKVISFNRNKIRVKKLLYLNICIG